MVHLELDKKKVDLARKSAGNIARDMQDFIDRYTSVTTERSVCRLFGIDGIDANEVPLPNRIVEHLQEKRALGQGVAYWIANAMIALDKTPQEVAELVVNEDLDLTSLPIADSYEVKLKALDVANDTAALIRKRKEERNAFLDEYSDSDDPWLYVIVATGNIYEDIIQAKAAARQGAEVIAVIRTTGQSLLDYVPYGATTEGFGGTMATQENFRLMRSALDDIGKEVKRYIRLCNYCSGLCMPEIAAMGAIERLDMMLNDALYGILFRDINMKRTMIDQAFSRRINAYAGIIINTGEDNYLTTADAYEEAYTVLGSQIMNEQFALLAGLPPEQMGLGGAYEIDPDVENSFVYELAQATLSRQVFPRMPLKYMPPTKYMTGNVFRGHIQDALFNIVTTITKQKVHLLGMMTEAIHTPFMSDRALSIENARYINRAMRSLGDEIEFKKGGMIEKRADAVLTEAVELLQKIEKVGLFHALEKGWFANIKRREDGGKGLDGVVEKDPGYENPFMEVLQLPKEMLVL